MDTRTYKQNNMKKWFTTDRIIMIGLIVTLIILLLNIDSCRGRKFSQQQGKIDSLTLANQKLVQDTNKLGQIISKQEIILTDNQKDLKKLTEDYFALQTKDKKRVKQINALIQEKTSTGVKDVDIPFEEEDEWVDSPADTALQGIPCDSLGYVKVPQSLNHSEEYFQFKAKLLKEGLHIDSLNFPDSQRIAVLETKGGLFKRDTSGKVKLYRRPSLEIQVLHTNPYIQVQGLSSVVYQPKPKARWLERAIIFAAGVFIGSKLK